jgi:Na+/H+ antiporter 1
MPSQRTSELLTMTDSAVGAGPASRGTAWARNLEAPLRGFLRTETGSAAILLAAAIVALASVNIDAGSYQRMWQTVLSIRVGHGGVSQELHHWVNDGLMAFFFIVVGLEARREFDLGELRDHRRLALLLAAALGGMLVPIAVYIAINGGRSSAGGLRRRPIPRSRSGCWRWSAGAFPPACARSSSRSPSPTTWSRSW